MYYYLNLILIRAVAVRLSTPLLGYSFVLVTVIADIGVVSYNFMTTEMESA